MTLVKNSLSIKGVTGAVSYLKYSGTGLFEETGFLPQEVSLTLHVNGTELVTIQCTPVKTNCLVVGFLYFENIIKGVEDILLLAVCEDERIAEVKVKNGELNLKKTRTLTSGCGGGSVFEADLRRVESSITIEANQILSLMKEFNEKTELFKISGGVHASALAENTRILFVAEDVGRHNTLDKLMGECLFTGVDPKDKILLTTGRISSEMLQKASKMGVPIVISRHSPTGTAFTMAQEAGITLICHTTSYRFSIYTYPERLR
ncbi:MAG: formate dehydrogenase accessory sulfurtransferase FdhD [Deltaproteobacteria bacterium]|nr:formate dehydrogenase accessory sulfurtransferase FdhD [Deltaproteobacteria bacterium]